MSPVFFLRGRRIENCNETTVFCTGRNTNQYLNTRLLVSVSNAAKCNGHQANSLTEHFLSLILVPLLP